MRDEAGSGVLSQAFYWCDLLVESGTVPERKMTPLQGETNELLAIFNTVAKNGKARRKRDEDKKMRMRDNQSLPTP